MKALKNVLLIGDSIRMGYQETVRDALKSVANVSWPAENGGTSQFVLDHLEPWVFARQPDVIHLNCGLHDLKRDRLKNEYSVPLGQYRDNLERILQELLDRTEAKVIWATITPVNEQWHNARKPFNRFEADVQAYNVAAAEICQRLGVTLNDLYGVVMQAGRDEYLQEDGVHFKETGYQLLGEAVARAVRAAL